MCGGEGSWHGMAVISLLDSTSYRYTHTHTHTHAHSRQALEYHYGKSCSEQAPDTSGPLFDRRHTHTHTQQTQTQAFHIANIITAITSDSNITLHLSLSLFALRLHLPRSSLLLPHSLCLSLLLLGTHVGAMYNHLCVCVCVCVCVCGGIMLYKHYLN